MTRRSVLGGVVAAAGASILAACRSLTSPPRAEGNAVVLGKVGILTANLDRSLAFYRRLGLDIPMIASGQSYYRLLGPADTILFWETAPAVHAFDPTWQLPPPANRRIALEFGFSTVRELEATYRAVVSDGAPSHLAPFDLGDGIRYAVVEDPDGNQISLRYPATG